MADKKISQLPSATTPLAGTEVLPIVQSGVTDKVSVANLTAGRAISATQYTSTIATGTAPLVVASTTEVANLKAATATLADSATSANAVKSNATTGVLQITGPAAASTRVMTTPDANFTAARTDAGQTFTGNQRVNGNFCINTPPSAWKSSYDFLEIGTYTGLATLGTDTELLCNAYVNSSDAWAYRANGYATRYSITENTGEHYWMIAPNNSSGAGAALSWSISGKLDSSGNLINYNNFVVGTSGKGIDFSATAGTGTSELLADYEEGTWTPTAYGGTTAGDTTYLSAAGTYVKVGRQVTLTGVLDISGMTGTGSLIIGGLPYSLANISSASLGNIFAKNLTIPTVSDLVLFGNGGTAVSVCGTGNATAYQFVQVDNTFTMYFSMTYVSAT